MSFPVEYSSLSSDSLLNLVRNNYSIGNDSKIIFLKRGFNDTYLIESPGQKFVLRVYKHNWRSLESIRTEMKILHHLKENGMSVSYPILFQNNQFVHTIDAPEGIRYAVLFSFAEGERVRQLNVKQAELLGVETGRLHAITLNKDFGETAQNYNIRHQFETTLHILKPILENFPAQLDYLKDLRSEFDSVFSNVNSNELAVGICHGDLQAENFHIQSPDRFTFFDFDFFGSGYLAYDIGVFIWYDHKNKPKEIVDAFLKGYQTQRALSETEIKLLPYFSALRALFQMTLYCRISDGKQLPVWPAQQVAEFIGKVEKWMKERT